MIRCQFENGSQTSLRHVCINALVIKDNQVLMCKRGTYKGEKIPEYGKWGLIGGYLDRDETLVEGLKREIMEETGWEVDNIQLLTINDSPTRPLEDKQNVDFIFFAYGVKKIGDSDEEVEELNWFDFNKLPPSEEIAFDHEQHLELYKRYLRKSFELPIVRGMR